MPWCNNDGVVPLVHASIFRGASNGDSMPILLPSSTLKATRRKVCLNNRFLRADSLCWRVASRHNAQRGRSLVDHHLHRDLIVGLQRKATNTPFWFGCNQFWSVWHQAAIRVTRFCYLKNQINLGRTPSKPISSRFDGCCNLRAKSRHSTYISDLSLESYCARIVFA